MIALGCIPGHKGGCTGKTAANIKQPTFNDVFGKCYLYLFKIALVLSEAVALKTSVDSYFGCRLNGSRPELQRGWSALACNPSLDGE